MGKDSLISGFYKLNTEERLKKVQEFADLTDEEVGILYNNFGSLGKGTAERMVENVIGARVLPIGIAPNFRINGKDYMVPMCIEEPSVVAGAANAAKYARKGDPENGILSHYLSDLMTGQVQIIEVDYETANKAIIENKQEIINLANSLDPNLIKVGGGARDLRAYKVKSDMGDFMYMELDVDCRDAMGANAVNTMCEGIAEYIEKITGGEVNLRILSNSAPKRTVEASMKVRVADLGTDKFSSEKVVKRFLWGDRFANWVSGRASTNNKGIMNGVDSVLVATGNDWRAVEAGSHSYAVRVGGYMSLADWQQEGEHLVGKLRTPMAVGIVGGAAKTDPVAKVCLKILGVNTAKELGEIVAAVGLAQTFAANYALSTVGIQKGHMELHAANIAVGAGAQGEEIDIIAQKMIGEKKIRADKAQELLTEYRAKNQ